METIDDDKFRMFMKVEKSSPFLAEWLTDRIIAAFFVALGVWGKYMPYHLKTGSHGESTGNIKTSHL
ncbi:hypothetical protein B484DRAFT_409461 [Ochromonadaceae sp. CCMP2298]|nr:hypothetical protein B484DRAFT_409461 [Ochromonadaceae sp. CCMP2298]